MRKVEFSLLGMDEGENGMLMYVPHQMKLLIKERSVTWERQDKKSMFINWHELETNKHMNRYVWYNMYVLPQSFQR